MGLGGISIWQLLIVLAIIILLFGTKRLRSFGSDLGSAVKGFRKSMNEADERNESEDQITEEQNDVIDSTVEKSEEKENQK